MPAFQTERYERQSLEQLFAIREQHDVAELLRASLERLVTFWPASAGALLYFTPYGETITLSHGTISAATARTIEAARANCTTRTEDNAPSVIYGTLDYHVVQLPLISGTQVVGVVHLVADTTSATPHAPPIEHDIAMLVAHSIGGEADKLAMLNHAEQDLRQLHLLYQVGQALSANLHFQSLLDDMTRAVPDVMGAERCSIMLMDEASHELVLNTIDEASGEPQEYRIPLNRGIAGWVATNGVGQIVNDVEQDERWFDGIARDTEFATHSILCAPMRVHERVVGVMQVLNKHGNEAFVEQDLQLLTTLASQAAIAVENAQLVRSLRSERDRLLAKEAEVRAAIARDLHDGPTQSVAAIAMNIEFVKKLLRAMPERVEHELELLNQLALKTSYDIRTLLFELRPLGLETQGLLATVEQYVHRFRDPTGAMHVRLEADRNVPRLALDVEGAVFMIVQEAVNNARKHAEASEVVIALRREPEHLIARVSDRGRGFNSLAVESSYNTRGSLGLLNMRERARLIGGELRIHSTEGEGTSIELQVPLG